MANKLINNIKIYLYIFILVIIDQLTKYWATIRLKNSEDIVIIKDVLNLSYLDGGNTGGAWGIFSGNIPFFIVFTIIVVLILNKFMHNLINITANNYSLKKSFCVLKYLIATLIAGAIGNFIDRVVLGYVIDFIYFKLINFPVFNVADCYASVSCILIIIICTFFITDEEFSQIFTFKLKRNKDDK